MMNKSDAGHIRDSGNGMRLQAKIKILEIEEKTGIEAAQLFPHLGAEQHKTAADNRRIPIHIQLVNHVSHLVMRQALMK